MNYGSSISVTLCCRHTMAKMVEASDFFKATNTAHTHHVTTGAGAPLPYLWIGASCTHSGITERIYFPLSGVVGTVLDHSYLMEDNSLWFHRHRQLQSISQNPHQLWTWRDYFTTVIDPKVFCQWYFCPVLECKDFLQINRNVTSIWRDFLSASSFSVGGQKYSDTCWEFMSERHHAESHFVLLITYNISITVSVHNGCSLWS